MGIQGLEAQVSVLDCCAILEAFLRHVNPYGAKGKSRIPKNLQYYLTAACLLILSPTYPLPFSKCRCR